MKNKKYNPFILIIVGIIAIAFGSGNAFKNESEHSATIVASQTVTQNELETNPSYSFKYEDRLQAHFEKHGAETHSATAEEYVQKANAVINNPNSLSKLEESESDGDTVYFLESTGELVILSSDGYIRTYFIADYNYFSRT